MRMLEIQVATMSLWEHSPRISKALILDDYGYRWQWTEETAKIICVDDYICEGEPGYFESQGYGALTFDEAIHSLWLGGYIGKTDTYDTTLLKDGSIIRPTFNEHNFFEQLKYLPDINPRTGEKSNYHWKNIWTMTKGQADSLIRQRGLDKESDQ